MPLIEGFLHKPEEPAGKDAATNADRTPRIHFSVLELGPAATIPHEPLNTPPAQVVISVDPPGQKQATLRAREWHQPGFRLKMLYKSARHPTRCQLREEGLQPVSPQHWEEGLENQEQQIQLSSAQVERMRATDAGSNQPSTAEPARTALTPSQQQCYKLAKFLRTPARAELAVAFQQFCCL